MSVCRTVSQIFSVK